MAHLRQRQFCESVQQRFKRFFRRVSVLDCGSLDINGNNRYLFDLNSTYTGIDIVKGENVDIVRRVHIHSGLYDTIISTEMLEHDEFYEYSLQNMVKMLKPGGLLLITVAYILRPEHGTHETNPDDSPLTNGYYKNLTIEDIWQTIPPTEIFDEFEFTVGDKGNDLYFWGIKKKESEDE